MRLHAGALLLASGLALALLWTVLSSPPLAPGPIEGIVQSLPATGATHPVTGVLLGFRAYDTLLEVAVVLLAVLAAGAARAAQGPAPAAPIDAPAAALLRALVNLLVPTAILAAGYFLWAGTHSPGGAFQAAAVLGAGGLLLRLAHVIPAPDADSAPVRLALAAGPGFFIAAFAANALAVLLLPVEGLLALSIGLALVCLTVAPRR
jgi:multisubunit Na+/H+ antiporter MnhB subunit